VAGWTPEVDLTMYRLIAAAFFGLSLLMPFGLRWAPIEFGVLWAVVLGIIGFRIRRLATKGG
jgi:hypothetical protein